MYKRNSPVKISVAYFHTTIICIIVISFADVVNVTYNHIIQSVENYMTDAIYFI